MIKLAGVVQQLKEERARAQNEAARLDDAIRILGGVGRIRKRLGTRRPLSAAARAKIAAAQRRRWAKVRRGKKAR
jgi:hypothetical protein